MENHFPKIPDVATRQGPYRRGTDHGRDLVRKLMREAEAARIAHGTSYASIGRAIKLGEGQVARIMRDQSPHVSVVRVAQILAAVGLELSANAFPVGPHVRDAGQIALVTRLRPRVHATLRFTEEVPVVELPTAGTADLRAWDFAIDGPGVHVRGDAETHIGDVQAVERRLALKQRDGRIDCIVLLLADTLHHRELLKAAGDGLRARFPVSQRAALAALRAGRAPAGNALVVL